TDARGQLDREPVHSAEDDRPPREPGAGTASADGSALLELVLQSLASLELRRLRRGDLDALAGLRVPARARFSLRDRERPETRDVHLVAVAQRLHDVLEDEVDSTLRLALRQVERGGDGFDQVGLGHRLFPLTGAAALATDPWAVNV